jgi:hypothetical protein
MKEKAILKKMINNLGKKIIDSGGRDELALKKLVKQLRTRISKIEGRRKKREEEKSAKNVLYFDAEKVDSEWIRQTLEKENQGLRFVLRKGERYKKGKKRRMRLDIIHADPALIKAVKLKIKRKIEAHTPSLDDEEKPASDPIAELEKRVSIIEKRVSIIEKKIGL